MLTSFQRPAPYRGPHARLDGKSLRRASWFAINARFTYAGGRGDFIQNEIAEGIDPLRHRAEPADVVTGNGDRPVTTGDLNLTLLPVRVSASSTTLRSPIRE